MPPGEISIGAMVRWLDREAALVECFHEESNQCLIASACGLRRPLAEAQEAFYRVLDRFTLEDVTGGRRRRELKELLCPPA